MADNLDRLLESLPYVDGSGRRRLVAGTLILGSIAIFNPGLLGDGAKEFISTLEFSTLISSPIVLVVMLVVAYSLGNLAEMLGEMFLVPAAGFLVGTLQGAFRPWWRRNRRPAEAQKLGFRLDLGDLLSEGAQRVLLSPDSNFALPDQVVAGMRYPVGFRSEFAFKYVSDRFTANSNRRWARQIIMRAKDVSAVATVAMLLLMIIAPPYVVETFGSLARQSASREERASRAAAALLEAVRSLKNSDVFVNNHGPVYQRLQESERLLNSTLVEGGSAVDVFPLVQRLTGNLKHLDDQLRETRELLATLTLRPVAYKDREVCKDLLLDASGLPTALDPGAAFWTLLDTEDQKVVSETLVTLRADIDRDECSDELRDRLTKIYGVVWPVLDPVGDSNLALLEPLYEAYVTAVLGKPSESFSSWGVRFVFFPVLLGLLYVVFLLNIRRGVVNILEMLAVDREVSRQ